MLETQLSQEEAERKAEAERTADAERKAEAELRRNGGRGCYPSCTDTTFLFFRSY